MRTLDKKFFTVFVFPCLGTLAVCIFLFLVADVFDMVDDLIKYRPPLLPVLKYVGYRFLYASFFMGPLVVAIGGFWGFSRWRETNQWTALLNSGRSPLDLLRVPVIILALLTVFGVYFNLYHVPTITSRFNEIEEYVIPGNEQPPARFKNLHFKTLEGHTVKIGRLRPDRKEALDFVIVRHEGENLQARVDAETARFMPGKGWKLDSPVVTEFGADGRIERTHPEEVIINFEPPGVLEKILNSSPRRVERRPEEFTVDELLTAIKFREKRGMNATPERIYYHWKFSYPTTLFVLGLFGLYLAVETKLSRAGGIGVLLVVALLYWALFYMILAYGRAGYFSFLDSFSLAYVSVYFTPALFLGGCVYIWSPLAFRTG